MAIRVEVDQFKRSGSLTYNEDTSTTSFEGVGPADCVLPSVELAELYVCVVTSERIIGPTVCVKSSVDLVEFAADRLLRTIRVFEELVKEYVKTVEDLQITLPVQPDPHYSVESLMWNLGAYGGCAPLLLALLIL